MEDKDYIYVNERFALSLLLQASGCFDSNVKCAKEDKEKVEKWIQNGAKPTDTVKALIEKAN